MRENARKYIEKKKTTEKVDAQTGVSYGKGLIVTFPKDTGGLKHPLNSLRDISTQAKMHFKIFLKEKITNN